MSGDGILRRELVALLKGGNAHDGLEEKLGNFPQEKINRPLPGSLTPNGADMSAWQLLEHLRICQEDILDFMRNPAYRERVFPRDYWPPDDGKAEAADWKRSLEAFRRDLKDLTDIALTAPDLSADLAHAPGYSYLRELLLAADHNSYHLGQIGLLEDL